jgi:hypothetical protein
MEQSWESFDVWQDFASARCTTKHVRGTAGWRQSWGCGWIFWCAPGALNKHSFERSPLDFFLLRPNPHQGDFHLVLNTCPLFKKRPVLKNIKFQWFRCFTHWNSDVHDLYVWQLLLCESCLPVPSLSEDLVLIQLRVYFATVPVVPHKAVAEVSKIGNL